MNFEDKSKLIDCPRCLGKGHVDKQDIIRLRRIFFWVPGPHCAFCNGIKRVELSFASRFNADDWFITSDLSLEMYQKYIDKDPELLAQLEAQEHYIQNISNLIIQYHYRLKLSKEDTRKIILDSFGSNSEELNNSITTFFEQAEFFIDEL
ncbi:MAG: hypothetical protein RL365_2149 [Bacteroidota bacterium]|jgi:hypothetical protein